MLIRKLKKAMCQLMLLTSALPVPAQDLLAERAPVHKNTRKADSITFHKFTVDFSEELYEDWRNDITHYKDASLLPNEFKIDLRDFSMPTDSRTLTSSYGKRWGRQHQGLDVKVHIGDTIRSAFSGKVRIVSNQKGGYGRLVVIRHNNGLETYYGHLSKQLVKKNQEVVAGQPIGLGGNTGRSTGPHLHFETRLCGVPIDPTLLFDFKNQDVTDDYYVFFLIPSQNTIDYILYYFGLHSWHVLIP